MLRNYLLIAFRNLNSQKFYTVINVVGLSIGITACILVAFYIRQDLNYDIYHKNAGQIYRIGFSITESGLTNYSAQTPARLGPALKELYPEIKTVTRICFSDRKLVTVDGKRYYEDKISYADSTFFDIFSYHAIQGDQTTFLKKPNTIILTESVSRKFFGKGNPIGKIMKINNKFSFEVTGVIQDVPMNSHFRFSMLATYPSLKDQPEGIYLPQWGATFGSYTYMLAGNGFDPKAFEKKTSGFFKKHSDINNENWKVTVIPLLDIHLKSHLENEIEENSSMTRIYIISSIALFILLLACINFVNLSTARSFKRTVEIGLRKAFGAGRFQLVQQFIGESVLLTLISFIFSVVVILIALPYFSRVAGTEIRLNFSEEWGTCLIIISGTLLVGILAGLYPALNFSTVPVVKVINWNTHTGKSGTSLLRKGLVVLQFSISIILIAGTIVINLQLRFLRNFNMGFDKKYMIVVPVQEKFADEYKSIKNELRSIPGILSETAGIGPPVSDNFLRTECRPGGLESNVGVFPIEVNSVDCDYFRHFGIKLVAGRNFSEKIAGDFPETMIVNEKMVRSLGFKDPQDAIGKSFFISLNEFRPKIIGVTRDYHSGSLHYEMANQVFMTNPRWFREFIIKADAANISSTINKIKDIFTRFFPRYPFEYYFLDESIDKMYKSEEKYSQVILVFSAIALFIACLGLLGLATFVTEQRKKEIGIRKVQGASVRNIVQLISGDFMILVIVANVIAWPVVYYFMNRWLMDFAYRITINLWVYFFAGGLAFMIALITVSFQSVKAAVANPAESLKCQ